MKKPEVSEYLKALRVVAEKGPDTEGFGLVKACKELYIQDFKAFMERLHELEKEHSKNMAIYRRMLDEQGSGAQEEAMAPKEAPPERDMPTDKVIDLCKELASNWR